MPEGIDKENSQAEPSFEEALSDLQRIAGELESGALGLEESLVRFEQGIALLRKCNAILERAEQKIEILTGRDAEGNPTTAPFDAAATTAAVPPATPAPQPPIERPRRTEAPEGNGPRPGKTRSVTETTVVVTEQAVVESSRDVPDDEDDDGPRLF